MRSWRLRFIAIFGPAFVAVCIGIFPAQQHRYAQAAESTVQNLFVGDITCADLASDCAHEGVIPAFRFMHVVVHDLPGNDDWQVQAAATCTDPMVTIIDGRPVGANGYFEVVLDMQATDASMFAGHPSCFVFRGRHHWAATFYAAYFDGSPVPDGDQIYPGYRNLQGLPDLPDLDVLFIHRTPSFAYDAHPNAPSPEKIVLFEAHLQNAGARDVIPFPYVWLLDGRPIQRGEVTSSLGPGQQVTLTVKWTWQDGPHDLTLQTHPHGPEVSSVNNALTIRTNALMLGFWVEKTAYQYFQLHQWLYCERLPCATSNSFADWLQRQASTWNGMLRTATYPGLTPNGVADRVRVDKIVIVPDGTLPLHGGRPTNSPDQSDRSVDLQWGLPAAGVEKAYHRLWEGPFDVDWGLIHELGHARYLSDLYRFDVPGRNGPAMRVTGADGHLMYDGSHPDNPANKIHSFTTATMETFLYQNVQRDIMTCSCMPFYSAYNALLLDRIQGRRPVCGNFNPPCNLGEWYAGMPSINRIRIIQQDGAPAADGTEVRLYQDMGATYTDHAFDDSHSSIYYTRRGEITLRRDPFHSGGSAWQAAHNLLLMEVRSQGTDDFCFQEPTDFNLAYWDGYRDSEHPATYVFQLGAEIGNGCNLRLPRRLVNQPFGTSASASSLTPAVPASGVASGKQMYAIRLLDASTPPIPMKNRRVNLVDLRGEIVASKVTSARGTASFRVPAGLAIAYADDVTDNNLRISLRAKGPSRQGVPRQ